MTPWYALYCTHERRARFALEDAGLEVFAPTYLRLTRYGRHRLLQPAPLLPRYIFARIPEGGFPAVLATEHVVYVLSSDGKPRDIPDEIISEVMRLVESGRMDERMPAKRARPRGVRLKGLASLNAWFDKAEPEMLEAA